MKGCEGGDFSVRKVPSLALPPRKDVGWGDVLGEEAASLREAPLSPDPSLPKSGWRLACAFLHGVVPPVRWARSPIKLGCGHGGSVSRRDHNQLTGNRAQLTAAYCMEEKPPQTAATLRERGAGGEALLLEKRPLPQFRPAPSLREGARGRVLLYREAASLAYPFLISLYIFR